jgi:CDP-glycerol glycerophosphotransferase (TagB/SpsB family)
MYKIKIEYLKLMTLFSIRALRLGSIGFLSIISDAQLASAILLLNEFYIGVLYFSYPKLKKLNGAYYYENEAEKNKLRFALGQTVVSEKINNTIFNGLVFLVVVLLLNDNEFLLKLVSALYFGLTGIYYLSLCYKFIIGCFSQKVTNVRILASNFQLVLHGSGPKGSSYQINQWSETFEKLPYSALILVRESHFIGEMHENGLPVVWVQKMTSLDEVLTDSVELIFYTSNANKNAHCFRRFEYKHIFINHGESDKVVNQNKVLRSYDKLFLAGEIAKNRLDEAGLEIDESKIKFVGRPQLEGILNIKESGDEIGLEEPIVLLYAPTWEGFSSNANYCSITPWIVEQIEEVLKIGITVIFKPHPYTGSVNNELNLIVKELTMLKRYENFYYESTGDLYNYMNQSDLLLCDVSSVLNDYLYTLKPSIVTEMSRDELSSFTPSMQASYVLKEAQGLVTLVNKVMESDSLILQRVALKEKSLGRHSKSASDSFSKAIEGMLVKR